MEMDDGMVSLVVNGVGDKEFAKKMCEQLERYTGHKFFVTNNGGVFGVRSFGRIPKGTDYQLFISGYICGFCAGSAEVAGNGIGRVTQNETASQPPQAL